MKDNEISQLEEKLSLIDEVNEGLVNEVARLKKGIIKRDELAVNQKNYYEDYTEKGVCFYCQTINNKHLDYCPFKCFPLEENDDNLLYEVILV